MLPPNTDTPLKQRIIERARMLGFDAVGVARADEPLGLEHERYLSGGDVVELEAEGLGVLRNQVVAPQEAGRA